MATSRKGPKSTNPVNEKDPTPRPVIERGKKKSEQNGIIRLLRCITGHQQTKRNASHILRRDGLQYPAKHGSVKIK